MINKRFSINLLSNIISFIVNIGISFMLTPFLIRALGKEAYGFFPLANSFIGYASIITVALNSMASRFITIKIEEKDIKSANIYFNSVLISNFILSFILTIAAVVTVINLNKILNIPNELLFDVKALFALVFLGLIISVITSVFGVATFAKNRLDLSSIRSIEGNIIKVILLFALFNLFKPSIWYLGVANTVVVIYMSITNLRYTKILLPEIQIDKKYNKFSAVRELLSSGIWNSINQLSVVLLTSLDLLITNIFLGAGVTGEYAIVKTVPMFIQSFVGILVSVFIPQFTILYAQKRQKELLENIQQSIKFMGLIITIPIGFLIIFGDVFFTIWVPGQESNKLRLLSNLTIIPMIITGSINTIFNVFTVTNKLKIPAIVLLGTGLLNIISVFTLLNTTNLGIYTIPIVSMVIGILRNIIFTPIYAARCLEIKWHTFYIAIFRGCMSFITVMIVSYVFKLIYLPQNWISLCILAVFTAVVSISINIFFVLNKAEKIIIKERVKKVLKIK
jgi:O-antigen/teichoic acid export membrane protein